MGARTLLFFLLGKRTAILELGEDRRALLPAFLLVLSAAIAREYDGADLVHEPWRILPPMAASAALAYLLYRSFWFWARLKEPAEARFWSGYVSFLTLFWLTAPLAWLYGIPFERFLDPMAAAHANIVCLEAVAAWRVLLAVRVAAVLTGCGWPAAFFTVMLVADAAGLAAAVFSPRPIIEVMAGIRVGPEKVFRDAMLELAIAGFFAFPVLLVGIVWCRNMDRAAGWRRPFLPPRKGTAAGPLAAFGGLSLAAWALLLPFTQPEQILRTRVETVFAGGRIEEALTLMNAHRREDFPPHWRPPPRPRTVFYHNGFPKLLETLEAIGTQPPPDWVREAYLENATDFVKAYGLSDDDLSRLRSALERIPGGQKVIERLPKRGATAPQ